MYARQVSVPQMRRRIVLRRMPARRSTLRAVAYLAGTVIGRNRNYIVLRPSVGGEIPVRFVNSRDADVNFAEGQFVALPVRYSHGSYCYARRYHSRKDAENYSYYNSGSYMNGLTVLSPRYWNDGEADDMYRSYYAQNTMYYDDGDPDDINGNYAGYGYNSHGYYDPNYDPYYNNADYSTYDPNYDNAGYSAYDPYYSNANYSAYNPYYNDPNYSTNNPYYGNYMGNNALQTIEGIIIARTGSNLVVLTPNFTPMIVDAGAAMDYGNTNGPLVAGRWITAYGYSANNTFVATFLT